MRSALTFSGIRLATFLVLVVTMGCNGKLAVDVAVLDPKYMEQEEDRILLRSTLPEVVAETATAITTHWDSVRQAHFQQYVDYGQALVDAAALDLPAEDRAAVDSLNVRLQNYFAEVIGPVYEETKKQIIDNQRRLRLVYDTPAVDSSAKVARRRELLELLRERSYRIDGFITYSRSTLDPLGLAEANSLAQALPSFDDRAVAASEVELMRRQRSLLQGQGLTTSPFAYVVASAPEDRWAQRFDRAYGQGDFGNLDIAIKMDQLGNFTIKGLSFDPSQVALAAAKVMTQTLLLTAQIAGVPVSVSGTSTDAGAALAQSSTRLENAAKASAKRQAHLAGFQYALQAIAKAILLEQQSIQGNGAQRTAALNAISTAYVSHRALIVLSTMEGANANSGGAGGTN